MTTAMNFSKRPSMYLISNSLDFSPTLIDDRTLVGL